MFYDAHQHLHDARLVPFRERIMAQLSGLGIAGGIVNGTSEKDWEAVARFCALHPGQRPAFGLHPWQAAARSARWESRLTGFLDGNPGATLGETGLDGRAGNCGMEEQKLVFVRQLAIARERNLAITVHCSKAHEPLRQVLARQEAPARGFLLHAWTGPAALTPFLLDCGAHFSFPPFFLHARRAAQRVLFQGLPEDRVLVETDAPGLVPPPEHNPWPLTHPETGESLNHPANLIVAGEALAALRGVSVAALAGSMAENWHRLFMSPAGG